MAVKVKLLAQKPENPNAGRPRKRKPGRTRLESRSEVPPRCVARLVQLPQHMSDKS